MDIETTKYLVLKTLNTYSLPKPTAMTLVTILIPYYYFFFLFNPHKNFLPHIAPSYRHCITLS